MQVVTTIGLDIAKSVFQVHGVDAAGQVLIGRQLKRRAVLAFFQKLPVVPCWFSLHSDTSTHQEEASQSSRPHAISIAIWLVMTRRHRRSRAPDQHPASANGVRWSINLSL